MFFEQTIQKILSEKNVKIEISGKDHFDIFEEMLNNEIPQNYIIEKFEQEMNIPFENIMECEPNYEIISKVSMSKIEELCIFPFKKEGILYIAISEPNTIQTIDILLGSNLEYVPCFCFDFLIQTKLESVEETMETDVSNNYGQEVIEINTNKKTIILATGQDNFNTIIETTSLFTNDYKVLERVDKREQLLDKCLSAKELPDIILVGENIGGKVPLTQVLLQIKSQLPEIRIIYLCGSIDNSDELKNITLGILASVGIYDIIAENEISVSLLKHILDNPRTEIDVADYTTKIKDKSGKNKSKAIQLTAPEEVETEETVHIYGNMFAFVSSKGGTGKTTIIQNVAIALNNYAMPNLTGRKIKIGIIDLDFQGFTTSHYFDTLNDEKTIFRAINNAKQLVEDDGTLITLSSVKEHEINELIRTSFVQSKKYKNIYVLGGSNTRYLTGDLNKLNSFVLTYILETVASDFDVILIDANSDIENKVIYPLYQMIKTIYNVLELSTPNFNLNKRYLTYLDDAGIYQPINNKFILNKFFDLSNSFLGLGDIQKALNIKFDNIIPLVDKNIMFNIECKNESLMDKDDDSLNEVKAEILELAHDIYPIKDYEGTMEKLSKEIASIKLSKDNKKESKKDNTENKTAENKSWKNLLKLSNKKNTKNEENKN